MNGFYIIYANTAYKKYLLMDTDNQAYAKAIQVLLEQMRRNGFLASGITSITVELG
jgi:hypothetical protein